jgi:Tfp pilus assembly protein PilF
MDDEIQVTNNPHVQNISEWPTYFTSSTMDSGGSGKMGGIYFKPLMTIYFAGIWAMFPNEPAAFRVPLLVMHVFSAFFIFLFLRRFFDPRLAFAAGFTFVIHPINSEIVAYIADAQDALYLFFGLLGLTLFLSLKSTRNACIALALCTLAALLGKETGALFLAIIPVAALLFDRRKFVPAMATVVGVFAAYMALRINSGLLSYEHRVLLIQQASYVERLMTIPLIVWHYIEIFFFPLRISLVTDFAVHDLNVLQFWLPLAGVVAFAGALCFLWRRLPFTNAPITRDARQIKRSEATSRPWFDFSRMSEQRRLFVFAMWILFLWFMLHGSILLPLDGTYADRWFYLANFALLILCALAIVTTKKIPRKVFAGAAVLFIVAATARTYVRLEDWATPIELYKREFAQRPFDALMANNVGFELFHRGEIIEAERLFEIATKNNPAWDVAWNNLGAAAQRQGKYDRALELYKKSVSLGTYYLAYENYAGLLCARSIDQNCRDFLAKALAILPKNPRLQEIDRVVNNR